LLFDVCVEGISQALGEAWQARAKASRA